MKNILMIAAAALFSSVALAQDASFPLELNGGYIDFNEDSNFRDTWYVGGSTGLNFTENAGIRGYYWHALDDGQIDEFDKLEIYGVETKVKAPLTEAVKPYLVVGGGVFKPYGNYEGENALLPAQNKFFGSAGAGLDLSFINFLSVTGYARALVSEFDQLNDVGEEDNNISASWNYGASINLRIGDKKNPLKIRKDEVEGSGEVPMPAAKVQADVDSYDKDARIRDLEKRLQEIEQKQQREEEMKQLRKEIREELVREYRLDESSKKKVTEEQVIVSNEKSEIISRLENLNSKLDNLEKKQEESTKSTKDAVSSIEEKQAKEEMKRELDREYLRGLKETMTEKEYKAVVKDVEVKEEDTFFDRVLYSHSDAFVGYGFGQDNYSSFLLGARPNFNFAGSDVLLSPEFSIGVGEKTSYNLLANALFDLNLNSSAVEPYLGLGAGFIAPEGEFKPAYNMIFGAELNSVMDGKFNVEFAGRNLFKYNQLTLGYEVF